MFGLQVFVDDRVLGKTWLDVRPKGGDPYRWETREEADRMAYICYGRDPSIVRVVEIKPMNRKEK